MIDEAAEAEFRRIRKLWDEMQFIRTGGINALFAHIDALAAEVERLKETVSYCEEEIGRYKEVVVSHNRLWKENDSLRDLVREAGEIVQFYRKWVKCQSTPSSQKWNTMGDKADAWRKKAQV